MNNRNLLENLKKIQNDPSYINNLTDDELNEIYSILTPTNNEVSSNSNKKERTLTKTNQYYRGEDTKTNNNFILKNKNPTKKGIDGFGVLLAFSLVVLIYGIVFILVVLNN